MPPTIRTRQQLLDLFIVNGIGAIVPGDDDDFIASTFGYYSLPRDPSPLDDSNNSGGTGQYFDTGSRWMNTTTGQWFKCQSGAVGAAIWTGQAYDGQPAGGRLTGTWPTPVLTLTGVIPGVYGDSTHYPTFSVQADGTIENAGEFPFPPGGVTIPTAQWVYEAGTMLSGTLPVGGIPVSAGDRIFTWDGISNLSWGIWIVDPLAWTRAPDMPAGMVFDGPAYVWVVVEEQYVPGMAQLMLLAPPSWGFGVNPGTWTLGTDAAEPHFANSLTTLGAGTFIHITPILSPIGNVEYVVNYDGPVTLDQWASSGGPISPVNINSGALPGGVTLNVAQLTVGVWPVTVFVPYSQISGAPPSLTSDTGDVTVITTASYVTIINVTDPNGIIGLFMIRNLGPNTGRIRVTTDDPFQGVQVNTSGIGSGTDMGPNDLCQGGGLLSLGRPPFTSLQVEVEDFIAGNHTSMLIAWALVEC